MHAGEDDPGDVGTVAGAGDQGDTGGKGSVGLFIAASAAPRWAVRREDGSKNPIDGGTSENARPYGPWWRSTTVPESAMPQSARLRPKPARRGSSVQRSSASGQRRSRGQVMVSPSSRSRPAMAARATARLATTATSPPSSRTRAAKNGARSRPAGPACRAGARGDGRGSGLWAGRVVSPWRCRRTCRRKASRSMVRYVSCGGWSGAPTGGRSSAAPAAGRGVRPAARKRGASESRPPRMASGASRPTAARATSQRRRRAETAAKPWKPSFHASGARRGSTTSGAKLEQQIGQRHARRARLLAGAAQARGKGQVLVALEAVEQGREHGADGTGVDRLVGVAAHGPVHGAEIGAAAAADAVEHRLVLGPQDAGATVVDDHHVQLLRTVDVVCASRAGDGRDVGRRPLAGAGPGEHRQHRLEAAPVGHEALHAHHDHVSRRQRGGTCGRCPRW